MRRLFYNLKITFKNKELIFWTFAFPIILGTFFFMAFSGISTAEEYEPIKIGVVKNEKSQLYPIYHNVIESISDEKTDSQVFNTTYFEEIDKAAEALDNKDIEGYVEFVENDFPKLTVKESGLSQTIIQNVFTEIEQSVMIGKPLEASKVKNTYAVSYEYTMIEYFSLIAMACLYGAMIVTKALNKSLANMTASGKRIAIASVSKAKIIITTIVTSYITQLIGLAILFFYLTCILGINFGDNFVTILWFTAIAALLGLSLGIFIATVFKIHEDLKDGMTTGITMFGCFFAGMMGPQMKYVIDTSLPILNKINPSAIITDGFYSIVSLGGGERLLFNVISMLVMSFILCFISVLILRRQKYDNL